MNEWYRWNTEAEAQAALDYINTHPTLPLVGKNAKTGQPAPDKEKTTKWADSVVACLDGKFGFPVMPQSYLNSIGISDEEYQQALAVFQPTIEEFDPAWLPSE